MATMSVTCGVSLVMMGIVTAAATAATASAAASGSWPMTMPVFSPFICEGCGQPKLSSTSGQPQSSSTLASSAQAHGPADPPTLPMITASFCSA